MKQIQEMRGKSSEDLVDLIDECKEKLFQLRFTAATEKLENASEVRRLRKSIAKAKTLLRERELQAEGAES